MTRDSRPAFDRLLSVHPHHVERIREAQARARVGTVAVFKAGAEGGAREFFTGIAPGSRVVITSRRGTGSLAVQSTEHRGAHLSVYSGEDVTVLDLPEWTHADAVAARDAAESNAAEALAVARQARANGYDKAALDALDESQESYLLGFALGIFAEYLHEDALRNPEWLTSETLNQ